MKNFEEFPEMESYDGVPDFGDFPFDFEDFPEMEKFDEEFPEMEKFDEEFPEMENFDEEFPEMKNFAEMENFDEEFPEMEKVEDFPGKEDYPVQNEEQAIKQRKKLVNSRGSRLISMEEGFGAESSK